YLHKLESDGLVRKKELGWAHLYFNTSMAHLPRTIVITFMQALLSGYKKELSDKTEKLKAIGRRILDHFQFPIGKSMVKEFERMSKIREPQEYLKLFEKIFNYFNLFEDDIDISIVELFKNKVIYRLRNSAFLDPSKDSYLFFYLACGITEAIYLKFVNKKIKSNVEKIHISNNKEESFIDISLEIKEEE
ncbi:MAG: hypothetical protein ACFFAH_07145, partial [Promethearchaeota archaeon]